MFYILDVLCTYNNNIIFHIKIANSIELKYVQVMTTLTQIVFGNIHLK